MFKSRPNKLALAISCGLLTLTGAVHAQQVNDKEIVEALSAENKSVVEKSTAETTNQVSTSNDVEAVSYTHLTLPTNREV